jgi:hypothetical protein
MSASLRWEIEGEKEAAGLIHQWQTRLRNPEPAFDEMLGVIATTQKDWFTSQGGGSWPQLKEPYRSWKRRKFPKRKILHGPDRVGHRGGQLRDDLTRRANGGRSFGVEQITKKGFEIGSDLDYAIVHQRGIGRMPRRPPLKELDDATVRRLKKILQAHIVGEAMGD